jgi:hypothetical protein
MNGGASLSTAQTTLRKFGKQQNIPTSQRMDLGDQNYEGGSTSRISYGSTLQNYTRWANDIGSGGTPNAALAGKGQVDFNASDKTVPIPSSGR